MSANKRKKTKKQIQSDVCEMFYRENEACTCIGNLGRRRLKEEVKEHSRTSLGCRLARARRAQASLFTLADNVGRHEVVPGLASSKARHLSFFFAIIDYLTLFLRRLYRILACACRAELVPGRQQPATLFAGCASHPRDQHAEKRKKNVTEKPRTSRIRTKQKQAGSTPPTSINKLYRRDQH